jgi:hypothetical protein
VLWAAEAWGMAPWVIEAQATAEWWERWQTYQEEVSQARAKAEESNQSDG